MCDRTVLLERIETAEDASPYCTCGAPMAAAERGGALWLECTAREQTRPGLRGLVDRLWIHSRQLICETAPAS